MFGVSERRACKVLGHPRSTHQYEPIPGEDEQGLTEEIVELASRYGRYGYRRVTALLRMEGWDVNHKRGLSDVGTPGVPLDPGSAHHLRHHVRSGATLMLEPSRRRLFLDTLRPPEGYVLDRAVGTSFTLDLMTLLAVPLAFTFSDVQDRDGQIPTEPLSLLESARRYADRIVVFCHGGQTGVPRARQPALAFIEQSVIAGFPPLRGQFKGIIHPKVWVLRYAPRDDTADRPIKYRLVCQSRNLTFDASWDASLVLDGELNQERAREYPLNGALVEFMRALHTLEVDPISDFQKESIEVFADELPSVRFDAPEGLEVSRFLPFGIGRRNVPYPDLEHRPLLVVSPFLDGEFLQSVVRRRPRSVLISRREALLTTQAAAVHAFDEVYAFKSGLEPESEDTEESLPPLAGLHAKVYVIDDGWKARIGIGSANSTEAALGEPPRNVEFMVELVGSKSKFGIDALLAPPSQGEAGTFRSLIEEFDPEEAGTVAKDEDAVRLDHMLDDAAETIVRADLKGTVDEFDTGRNRVPGSGVRGRGSGERETTASSLAGKEESSRKEDNSGQGKDGPAGVVAQGGNGR